MYIFVHLIKTELFIQLKLINKEFQICEPKFEIFEWNPNEIKEMRII